MVLVSKVLIGFHRFPVVQFSKNVVLSLSGSPRFSVVSSEWFSSGFSMVPIDSHGSHSRFSMVQSGLAAGGMFNAGNACMAVVGLISAMQFLKFTVSGGPATVVFRQHGSPVTSPN